MSGIPAAFAPAYLPPAPSVPRSCAATPKVALAHTRENAASYPAGQSNRQTSPSKPPTVAPTDESAQHPCLGLRNPLLRPQFCLSRSYGQYQVSAVVLNVQIVMPFIALPSQTRHSM